MRKTATATGVLVHHPHGVVVSPARAPAETPSGRRLAPEGASAAATSAIEALLAGLAWQGFRTQEAFQIAPEATTAQRRRGLPMPAAALPVVHGPITIEVPLADDEAAVVLLERDEVLAWRFPEPPSASPGPRRASADAAAGRRAALFRLGEAPPATASRAGDGRRGPLLDALSGALLEPVRAIVLKFAARKLVAVAQGRLEEGLNPGLVRLTGADPAGWAAQSAKETGPPATPPGRAPRVLLLLHGCFSSTAGSFGALGATDWGRSFLDAARARYDLVLGYDHPTLSATPVENARGLLDALRGLNLPAPPVVDAVAFSRGGLVLRALAEDLLPEFAAKWPVPRLGRAVFVACPNAGTALAESENWRDFLDVYTNLAAAAGKALGLFGGGVAGTVLSESVKTLGGLVQAVVTAAVADRMVPGLAAMRPLASTSQAPAAPPAAGAVEDQGCRYYALAADFDAGAQAEPAPFTALPRHLLSRLLDRAVDRLMGGPNDLVVGVDSAADFGAQGDRVDGRLLWGRTADIYHTNYFLHPEVVAAVGRCLEAPPPGAAAPAPARSADLVMERPVAVLEAGQPLARALDQLARHPAEAPVVIRREHFGQTLYYPRRVGGLRLAPPPPAGASGPSILDALGLREQDSGDVEQGAPSVPAVIGPRGLVRLSDAGVDGVVPPPDLPQALAGRAVAPSWVSPALPGPPENKWLGVFFRDAPSPQDGSHGNAAAPPESPAPRRSAGAGGRWPPLPAAPAAAAPASEPPAMSAAVPEEEQEVTCDVAAEMTERATLGEEVRLEVTISRERIDIDAGPARARAGATFHRDQRITLEVVPRRNCRVVGPAEASEIAVPGPGNPGHYVFKVAGTRAGPAELWVEARQGARRLARLVLQPVFVPAEGVLRAATVASTREPDPPMLELRIYEEADGPDRPFRLRFALTSRDLDLNHDALTDEFPTPREQYVASLYERLEGEWGNNKDDFENFMSQLRAYGAEIFEKVVPLKMREAIWANRDKIGSIEVISHEPFIPWEVAHVVEPGRRLPLDGNMFLAELGMVRWISNVRWPPALLRLRDGLARYVVPDYPEPDWQLPSAVDEVALLRNLFAATPVPPKSREVLRTLAAPGSFDLMHFACHGEADPSRIWDAALLVQVRRDGDGRLVKDVLRANQIEQTAALDDLSGARPIVFLNACQLGKTGRTLSGSGGMAEAFIRSGAGLFVGTLWSVGDRTALTFAETFYRRLREGATVTQATRAARAAAKAANEPTWLAYSVYGHPYARLKPVGQWRARAGAAGGG